MTFINLLYMVVHKNTTLKACIFSQIIYNATIKIQNTGWWAYLEQGGNGYWWGLTAGALDSIQSLQGLPEYLT